MMIKDGRLRPRPPPPPRPSCRHWMKASVRCNFTLLRNERSSVAILRAILGSNARESIIAAAAVSFSAPFEISHGRAGGVREGIGEGRKEEDEAKRKGVESDLP